MSPVLRRASPRATSAAISADGCWLGRDCVAGGEVVRDVVGGVTCFSAGAGEEATDDRASGPRAVWPGGMAGGEVARTVVKSSTGAGTAGDGVGSGISSG